MEINFINVPTQYQPLIKKTVKDFFHNYPISQRAAVNIQFVSSRKIRALNKKYRQCDEPTDVLSFPIWKKLDGIPDKTKLDLGDIIICPQETRLTEELPKLVIHSLRHLIGKHH
jgi:probable rRNA maturation factor